MLKKGSGMFKTYFEPVRKDSTFRGREEGYEHSVNTLLSYPAITDKTNLRNGKYCAALRAGSHVISVTYVIRQIDVRDRRTALVDC
jgi:hypothetical protein